jgi:VIT1/CCC1 family predicted Fe2+/Mn2+ transporter
LATLLAFVVAGAIPLTPYVLGVTAGDRLFWSTVMTSAALFGLGALRAAVTVDRWWKSGIETLGLGVVVAIAAYGAGAMVASVAGH